MELYDFYVQITQDLEEIKRSGEMGSVLMLQLLTSKFPKTIKEDFSKYKVQNRVATSTEAGLLKDYMEHARGVQREVLKQVPSGHVKPGGGKEKCGFCNITGHGESVCWKKHERPGKEGKPGAPGGGKKQRANLADMTKPQKPCPACAVQHTFVARRTGTTCYKSRLSACDTFRSKPVNDRAKIVEESKACALCLDWTGDHTKDNCDAKVKGDPFPRCDVATNSVACGRAHNRLLHGTLNQYCLYTRHRVRAKAFQAGATPAADDNEDDLCAPHEDEILSDENVLMPMQSIVAVGRGARKVVSVAWDKGSTTVMIRKAVAQALNLPGIPVTLQLFPIWLEGCIPLVIS